MTLVEITVTMLCFGMGASSQALFARVGGGIFTKAADVGADLVGKVEAGHSGGRSAQSGDDCGQRGRQRRRRGRHGCRLVRIVLRFDSGHRRFGRGRLFRFDAGAGRNDSDIQAQLQALFLPMAIAGVGIFLSIAGMYMVRTEEGATQKNLLAALARGINASTFLVAIASHRPGLVADAADRRHAGRTRIPGVAFSVIVGSRGRLVDRQVDRILRPATNTRRRKKLADQALTGPATVIIGGIADGMLSVWFPVLVVCVGTILAFGFAAGWNFGDVNYFALGLYGVGIAAVGMLSTLGITLATDAYGPIADNAGGNAEMSGLDPDVRAAHGRLGQLWATPPPPRARGLPSARRP